MSGIKYPGIRLFAFVVLIVSSACLWGADEKSFVVTDQMRAEARYVIASLEKVQFHKTPIKDLDSPKFIDNFLSDLDLNHLFFTQSQVDAFHERFDRPMTTYLKQGNIYPAFEIYKTFHKNFLYRIQWVFNRLEAPFNFKETAAYTPSRKDMPWPKSLQKSNDLWESRLKYELINEILSESKDKTKDKEETKKVKLSSAEKLKEAIENVRKRYERLKETINDIEASEVQEIYLTTLSQMHDPHSTYFSAESLADFSMMLSNSLVGIGASLSVEDTYVTVKELIAGGPAERGQELKPNDKIVGVAQGNKEFVDIVGMKLRKAVGLIRGKEGTTVRLLIQPAEGDPSDRKIITIVRDEIRLTANLAEARLYELDQNNKKIKVGVINVPAFYAPHDQDPNEPSTTRDVEELVNKLKKMNVQGIVLDLRHNGGGLLPEAITLTGLFIPIGPVVHVKDARGQVKEYIDTNPEIAWKGPLLVMVTKFSASASEIFVGALKTYNRAIIIGDTSTHGKGTVQVLSQINRPIASSLWSKNPPKMGATKFTIQKWYLPDGSSTQLKGVPSHIIIPSVNEFLPVSEADLPNAMAWDSIHTMPWTYDTKNAYTDNVYEDTIKILRDMSLKRQDSLEEFSFLKSNIEFFKQKQKQKEFSLNLKKRKTQREKDNSHRDEMKEWLDKISKNKYPVLDVKLDFATNEVDSEEKTTAFHHNKKSITGDDSSGFDIYEREGVRIMADYINLRLQDDPRKLQEEISN